jgi:hypothetical protein
VFWGAVLPVVAVVAAPRLGRDGLHHHPVGALDPGQVEQVLAVLMLYELRVLEEVMSVFELLKSYTNSK